MFSQFCSTVGSWLGDVGLPTCSPDVMESLFSFPCAFCGVGSVPSGDMPGSRTPATDESVAEGPPRDPGMHDPRHHAASYSTAFHEAHGLGLSGSQSWAWIPPAAEPAD